MSGDDYKVRPPSVMYNLRMRKQMPRQTPQRLLEESELGFRVVSWMEAEELGVGAWTIEGRADLLDD